MDESTMQHFIDAQKAEHDVSFYESMGECNVLITQWLVSKNDNELNVIISILDSLSEMASSGWGTNEQVAMVRSSLGVIQRALNL